MLLQTLLILGLTNTAFGESCSKIVEFSACSSKASNRIAGCNNLVVDTPTFQFWNCICDSYTASLDCYAICPDDPQLQLQRRSQEQTRFGTCQYVDQLKKEGKAAPRLKTTTTVIGSRTISAVIPSTSDDSELPPLPVRSNTNSFPISVDNEGFMHRVSAMIALVAGLFAFALF
jgi:hypothetical protein